MDVTHCPAEHGCLCPRSQRPAATALLTEFTHSNTERGSLQQLIMHAWPAISEGSDRAIVFYQLGMTFYLLDRSFLKDDLPPKLITATACKIAPTIQSTSGASKARSGAGSFSATAIEHSAGRREPCIRKIDTVRSGQASAVGTI